MNKSNLAATIAGLGAHLATAETPPPRMLDVNLIYSEEQDRDDIDDNDPELQELAEDVKKHRGIKQPILTRPRGDRFLIVFGERRWRAAKLAGLKHIPAYVEDLTDEQAEDLQLSENIHRKNLTLMQQARAVTKRYNRLKATEKGNLIDAVAAKVGKSRAWVSKRLSAAKLKYTMPLLEKRVTEDMEILQPLESLHGIDVKAFDKVYKGLEEGTETRESVRAALEKAKGKEPKADKPAKKGKDAGGEGDGSDDSTGGLGLDFDVTEAIYMASFPDDQAPGVVAGWTGEEREAVNQRLKKHWDAGKGDRIKGPSFTIQHMMKWFQGAQESNGPSGGEFRAYLAGFADEEFNPTGILAAARECLGNKGKKQAKKA